MKIFIVDPGKFSYPYDYSLSNSLSDTGNDVKLIGSKFKYGQEIPGAKYDEVLFFYKLTSFFSSFKWFNSSFQVVVKGLEHIVCQFFLFFYILFYKPDVIHVQWVVLKYFDSVIYRILIKLGFNIVYTAHNLIPHDTTKVGSWSFVYSTFNKIVVHTHAVKNRLLELDLVDEESVISVIPHGDLSYVNSYKPISEDWFEQFQSKNRGKVVFLLFGIIKPYKGLDLLINVAQHFPNCIFLVVGKVGDGNYFEKVLDKINEQDVHSSFYFHTQFVKDEFLPVLAEGCDAALMPYKDICQSGVFYLMAELKLPIISSDVGLFPQMLSDNRGLVFSLNQKDSLMSVISKFLSLSEIVRMELVTNNIEYIRQNYSWSIVSKKTTELYKADYV
ncbi:glycosyltransferase [Shewanella basaltis]|uniref:glycosyltransferase n=1 Tax=Shewanella basaltis TaxID=472183 RepID=UPI003AAFABFB